MINARLEVSELCDMVLKCIQSVMCVSVMVKLLNV